MTLVAKASTPSPFCPAALNLIAAYLFFVKLVLIVAAVIIFVSSIDDLIIDVVAMLRLVYRRPIDFKRHRRLSTDDLLAKPEQYIAIMVPAWQEAPVVAQMVENAIGAFNYSNYHIFVGTYPNDPETGLEVDRMHERYQNIHRVVCPHDGPTSKADCLNWIYQTVLLYEQEHSIEFAASILHDAEDVVHPLELKLFNYLMPRFGMVQITVRVSRRTQLMFFGDTAMEGLRYIWWNFVSSCKERIEQAKEDWKSGRFRPVPGKTVFIPRPEV